MISCGAVRTWADLSKEQQSTFPQFSPACPEEHRTYSRILLAKEMLKTFLNVGRYPCQGTRHMLAEIPVTHTGEHSMFKVT